MTTGLLVRGSATFDVLIRTGAATALTLPTALALTQREVRAEDELLPFYAELARRRDADAVFAPPVAQAVVNVSPAPDRAVAGIDGEINMLSFQSPYVALHPQLRDRYGAHEANRTAWAQHWRHAEPRPTLIVIHGFGASPYWLNSRFFALPWMYRRGYDILLYLLPFHGVRQARAAFSGWGLFAHGLAHLNEAIIHAVHDLRLFMSYLADRGVPDVAVTGLSLGGYVSSLMAAVEPNLAAVVPNAPVSDIAPLARQWFPANLLLAAALALSRRSWDELNAALAVHSPLNYAPRVPRDRRMLIGGLGDRLAPPEQTRWLWEHWERPRIHWFPGSHILHFGRGNYLKEMLGFMRERGFG